MNRPTLAAAFVLSGIGLFGQNEASSALRGTVRDTAGHPVASAWVQVKTTSQTFAAATDSEGEYLFRGLSEASYTLHAGATGVGEITFGPFPLGRDENKRIDLTLATAAKPEFFDEPSFVAAGVVDTSQRGGHGSDPILHSADSLAKAAASLRAGPSNAESEDALRAAIEREPGRASLHHSLAEVEEKAGHSLEAVREYQRAAELESSEANFFDWGVELLTHRATEQAIEVLAKGSRLFPRSPRMLLGLGVALYSRGSYSEAAQQFFDAADLNPNDAAPYMLLGGVSSAAITETSGFAERMERFARLQPENAWANLYYARSLLRHRTEENEMGRLNQARSLLEKAVRLDPRLGAAFLELGVVFAEQGDVTRAVSAYRNAIAASPPMEEAHYRLAHIYRTQGNSAKAQEELELYQRLTEQSEQKFQRERDGIQQFVFALRDKQPQ
jgi:tetratricopeptide (TPR) repeat protein